MKVLITGGAGFIGHNVAMFLRDFGFDVVVFDSLKRSSESSVKRLIERNIPMLKGDVLNAYALNDALRGVDVVVHAAAYISVGESFKKPTLYLKNNVLGTASIAKACLNKGVKLLIYLSSAAVYGEPVNPPISEMHPTNPTSPYGLSKLMGEEVVRFYSKYGLKHVILRLFNVYGLGQSKAYAGVVAKFIERAVKGLPPIIYGDGEQTRDFMHVNDVSEAIKQTIEKNVVNETFNIGSGIPTKIKDLAELVMNIVKLDRKPIHRKPRVGDIKHSYADISKAENLIDFKPRVNLNEGLKELIEAKLTN
ncbi:MAG: NAD-dependent epimerase/dehydratase family protein [Candidatus Bathyarchaeia archaeon]